MKIGCYARVSTQDQQTLPLQRDAIAAYAQQRGWSIVVTIKPRHDILVTSGNLS
jgi:DNA invertase Pin-like site-specific DNA recombinase